MFYKHSYHLWCYIFLLYRFLYYIPYCYSLIIQRRDPTIAAAAAGEVPENEQPRPAYEPTFAEPPHKRVRSAEPDAGISV
jgi:hypothetical protein